MSLPVSPGLSGVENALEDTTLTEGELAAATLALPCMQFRPSGWYATPKAARVPMDRAHTAAIFAQCPEAALQTLCQCEQWRVMGVDAEYPRGEENLLRASPQIIQGAAPQLLARTLR